LEVPTRFQVPVSGVLRWAQSQGWELPKLEVPFELKPREPLRIPLQARLSPAGWDRSPKLTIEFSPGRFRNRTIEAFPFKITGPPQVSLVSMARPRIDGKADDREWKAAPVVPLLGSGNSFARLGTDGKLLFVLAQLEDAPGQVKVA